jgi:hypothetical protein
MKLIMPENNARAITDSASCDLEKWLGKFYPIQKTRRNGGSFATSERERESVIQRKREKKAYLDLLLP